MRKSNLILNALLTGLILVGGMGLTGCDEVATDAPATATPDTEQRASAIVGGQNESGYAAVGALVDNGEAFCTGTLVQPDIVITAAHCFDGFTSAAGLGFFIGTDANAGNGETIPVEAFYSHPGFDWDTVANDVAVMKLSRNASATPIPYLTTSMDSSFIGERPLFVGYGITGGQRDDAGIKRSVEIPITEVDATTFTYEGRGVNTCSGDSGGPALLTVNGQLRLLGVTSYGDENCVEYGVNARVDAFQDFIQSAINGTATPGGTGGGNNGGGGDFCEEEGWYNDGFCDEDCPNPDPDCGGNGGGGNNGGGNNGGGGDFCEEEGWYNDGFCDEDCPNPDPDCSGNGGGGGFDDGDDFNDGDDFGDDDFGDDDNGFVGDGLGGAGCSVTGGGSNGTTLPMLLVFGLLVIPALRRRKAQDA